MKKSILLPVLTLLVVTGAGSFWWSRENLIQAESIPEAPHPFEVLNQKARTARTGDFDAAQELVDETFRLTGFEDKLRGSTADMIKQRVGLAENRFQQGRTAGIPEGRVVRTINGLANILKLPEFARTDVYEVRKLRLALLPSFPQFIDQRARSSQPVRAGGVLGSNMSPAEVLFVTQMMIQQKLSNEEYQVTRAERLSRWAETHNSRAGRDGTQSQTSGRSREIRDALDRGARSLPFSSTMQLSTRILNTLGIDK